MTTPSDTPADLRRRIDHALAARRARPIEETAAILAAAAGRWADDPALPRDADTMRLSPTMLHRIVAHVRDALAGPALLALAHGDPLGSTGTEPALVGHVLASNIPALGIPAVAHACLLGAAVVLKSGRYDPRSAGRFQAAVAREDPALGATIVATYWPGLDAAREHAAFERANVVVGTGGDETIASLQARWPNGFVGHGNRTSVMVVTAEAAVDLDPLLERVAYDIALYEQRGCLSPHALFVERADATTLDRLASRLVGHLERLAAGFPIVPADATERARVRSACDDTEWVAGARVWRAAGGTVIRDLRPEFLAPIGGRTVRLQPLDRLADLPALLPAGQIEAVGAAGDVTSIVSALDARGVSRICRPGTMQTPPIDWPRGQRSPLASLRGTTARCHVRVEIRGVGVDGDAFGS